MVSTTYGCRKPQRTGETQSRLNEQGHRAPSARRIIRDRDEDAEVEQDSRLILGCFDLVMDFRIRSMQSDKEQVEILHVLTIQVLYAL